MTEPSTALKIEVLRGALISAGGCIVDLYQIVSTLSAQMPTVGPNTQLEASMRSLERRINTMIERLDETGESDGK